MADEPFPNLEANEGDRGLESSKAADIPEGAASATLPAVLDPLKEGLVPLYISNQTIDLFGLRELTTGAGPLHMAVPKVNLVADMFTRAAISDFTPAKKQIQSFTGAELIIVYDPEWSHGQNFYLLVTPDATQAYLDSILPKAKKRLSSVSAVADAADAGLPAVAPKPTSKKWISLGSEEEVDWETVRPTRDRITLKLSRKLREFGAPCSFSDAPLKQFVEIKSYTAADEANAQQQADPNSRPIQYTRRTLLTTGTQAVAELTDSDSQTTWNRPQNAIMQYEPRSLSKEQVDAALESVELEEFVGSSYNLLQHALRFNNVANIFQDNYKDLGDEDVVFERSTLTGLQELQSFTSIRRSKDKSASAIDWHPTFKGVLAVSCVRKSTFNERQEITAIPRENQSCVLIWNVKDPIHPQLLLELPDDIVCFKFNPEEPHIAAGGCLNGQIVLWDLSEYTDYLCGRKLSIRDSGESRSLDKNQSNVTGNQILHKGSEFKGVKDAVDMPHVQYSVTSSIEHGHKSVVTDLCWLPKAAELKGPGGEICLGSEMGHMQLASVSLDGNLLFWDMRQKKDFKSLDLTWRPFFRAPMLYADNTNAYGLTKLALLMVPGLKEAANKGAPVSANVTAAKPGNGSPTLSPVKRANANKVDPIVSSRFFAVSEEGDVLVGDWAGDKSAATGAGEDKLSSKLLKSFSVHAGPVTDLQRSPFFPEILLSVGGWSFAIWHEDVLTGPLVESVPAAHSLICGLWSPTRPGVFFLGRTDGTIEIWDLTSSSFAPIQLHSVGSSTISSMALKSTTVLLGSKQQGEAKGGKGPSTRTVTRQYLAVGTDSNTLHVLEIPPHLSKASKMEKKLVKSFFDRQQLYLAGVQERLAQRAREKAVFAEQQAKLLLQAAAEKAALYNGAPHSKPESARASSGGVLSSAESTDSSLNSTVSQSKALEEKRERDLQEALLQAQAFEASYRDLESKFLESMSLPVS